jgi:hypothetical protein
VRRLVYLSGEPGVGKSTLMAAATAGFDRTPLPAADTAPARDLLRTVAPGELTPRVVAVELGRRRDTFSGTDALPQNAVTAAVHYLRSGWAARETPLLLAEGARLACRRFLSAAVDAGWDVTLLHLHGPALAAARRARRALALGVPEQNPAWVKGRRTAADNLARDAPTWGVHVMAVDAARLAADPGYRDAITAGITAQHTAPTPR